MKLCNLHFNAFLFALQTGLLFIHCLGGLKTLANPECQHVPDLSIGFKDLFRASLGPL